MNDNLFVIFHRLNMKNLRAYVVIALMGSVLFIPFLGASHLFDWDEINFAEASREMIVTGNYTQTQIDFHQFWEKPPFFFWLQSASMHIFGVNEFAARFPNAICGILTLMILYAIGKRLRDERLAGWWVICYAGSMLPQFYFKSGIIDPWFNLFIFLGVYGWIRYVQDNKQLKWIVFSGIFAGLSMLTKGPVGVGLIGISVGIWYLSTRFRKFPNLWHILVFLICVAAPMAPWVAIEISHNGTWFIKEFFTYQTRLATTEDASHGGFLLYHFVVILFLCFPASAFAIGNIIKKNNVEQQHADFRKWMIILLSVVLVVFTIVQTKIAHYSSMAYFPLTFLAAQRLANIDKRWSSVEIVLIAVTGFVFSVSLFAIPFVLQRPELLETYILDPFSKEALRADAHWQGWEPILGMLMLGCCLFTVIWAMRSRGSAAITWLFLSSMVIINISINTITPHIERYSQGAMIDFLDEKSREDVYTDVIGLKSYAQLFYGKRTPKDVNNPRFKAWAARTYPDVAEFDAIKWRSAYGKWLREGDIDKPVWMVTNARKQQLFIGMPGFEPRGNKNGFYFFYRAPQP